MSVKCLIDAEKTHLTQCLPNDFLDEAIELLVNANRNAVAVIEDGNKLRGILTDHDIVRAVYATQRKASSIEHEHVSDWMTSIVITCDVSTKLTAALKLMGRHQIRHLIVTEESLPVAVVSIRDILGKIHEHDELEVNVLRDIAIAYRATVPA